MSSLKELGFFIVFLISLMFISWEYCGRNDYDIPFYQNYVYESFVYEEFDENHNGFLDIASLEEAWTWLKVDLLGAVYADEWPYIKNGGERDSMPDPIVRMSKLVGRPRVRQVRTRPDSCTPNAIFADKFDNLCFATIDETTEDRRPFSAGGVDFVWSPEDVLPIVVSINQFNTVIACI